MLAFPPYDYYLLLWAGFLPLLIALEDTTNREAYLLGILMGTAGIMASFPWLIHVNRIYLELPVPVNYFVWFGYSFIHGQVLGIAALTYRFVQSRTKLPPVLLFPFIFAAVWSLIPTLFFFNLANGTVPFKVALQPIEFLGTWSLDVIILLSSALLYSLLRLSRFKYNIPAISAGVLIVTAWFFSGYHLYDSWKQKINSWSKKNIGIVQSNRPSSRYILPPAKGFSDRYPLAMDLSFKLPLQKNHLIVWPEGNLYKYFEDLDVHESFIKNVKKLGVPLLFHDYPYDFKKGKTLYRNSSVALSKEGKFLGRYDKRFIVPFGEYIPFLDYDGKLAQWFNVPPPLTPGEGPEIFELSGMKVQPLICYEVAFTDFVSESVGTNPRGRILVVQSNDGWYGTGGQVYQHNSAVYLRAIEHRLPVIHVLNNGPSIAVSPEGRNRFTSPFWERGSWTVSMPYSADSGGSLYSRHPYIFLLFIRIIFSGLLLACFRKKITEFYNMIRWKNSEEMKN